MKNQMQIRNINKGSLFLIYLNKNTNPKLQANFQVLKAKTKEAKCATFCRNKLFFPNTMSQRFLYDL